MADEEVKKEENKIKELLTKINLVKTSLIEERKKTQNYLGRIKEFEKTLQDKDAQISEITKEKFQLEAQLNFEKNKKPVRKSGFFDKIFHKEKFSNEKLEELKAENQKIREASKNLSHQIEEEKELYDQDKIKFQTQLTVKTEQFKKLQEEIGKLQKKLSELMKENAEINEKKKKYDEEKKQYTDKLSEWEKKKEESEDNIKKSEKFLADAQLEITKADNEIKQLNKKLNDMAVKLGETKIQITNKNLSKRVFKAKKVEKIFSDKLVKIIFDKDEEEPNKFLMIIQEEGKPDKSINLLNINTFELNEKMKNRIEVKYINEAKENKNLGLVVHEKITDYVMNSYREFFKEANKYM